MSNKQNLPLPGWAAAINAVSRAFGVFSAGLIVLSIIVVCHMVFVRAVLGESSIWQTEFVTFSLVAATFLAAPFILLSRGHVCVDVVPLMLATSMRRRLHFAGSVIALVFCAIFFYASIPWWWDAWTTGQTTPSIWKARMWIPMLAVPLGLGLLCLQYLTEIWLVLSHRALPFGLSAEDTL
ncbi:MAG: TRAP transporter small permease [Sulfuritalea sp.]|nr:TRAP transporter small permease [Sulfuritalea sp.]